MNSETIRPVERRTVVKGALWSVPVVAAAVAAPAAAASIVPSPITVTLVPDGGGPFRSAMLHDGTRLTPTRLAAVRASTFDNISFASATPEDLTPLVVNFSVRYTSGLPQIDGVPVHTFGVAEVAGNPIELTLIDEGPDRPPTVSSSFAVEIRGGVLMLLTWRFTDSAAQYRSEPGWDHENHYLLTTVVTQDDTVIFSSSDTITIHLNDLFL